MKDRLFPVRKRPVVQRISDNWHDRSQRYSEKSSPTLDKLLGNSYTNQAPLG